MTQKAWPNLDHSWSGDLRDGEPWTGKMLTQTYSRKKIGRKQKNGFPRSRLSFLLYAEMGIQVDFNDKETNEVPWFCSKFLKGVVLFVSHMFKFYIFQCESLELHFKNDIFYCVYFKNRFKSSIVDFKIHFKWVLSRIIGHWDEFQPLSVQRLLNCYHVNPFWRKEAL